MGDTFTQLHVHIVFAVKNRTPSLKKEWRTRLYEYMTAIIQNHGHKLIQIGGIEDHVHILIGMGPNEALSELIMEVKRDSCKWINENIFVRGHFYWQAGYGAFSVSTSIISRVCGYIENQEVHHRGMSSQEEKQIMIQKSMRQLEGNNYQDDQKQ